MPRWYFLSLVIFVDKSNARSIKLPDRHTTDNLQEWFRSYQDHDPENQYAGYGLHSVVQEQFGQKDDSCFENQELLNKCCIFEPTHYDCWDVLGRYTYPRCCVDMLTPEPGQCLFGSFHGQLLAGQQLEDIMNSVIGVAVGGYFPGLSKTIYAMIGNPGDYTFNKFSCPLGWSYLILFRARESFSIFEHNFVDVSPLAGAVKDLSAFYSQFTVRRAFLQEDRILQARPTVRPYDTILQELEKEVRTHVFSIQARSFLSKTGTFPQMYCECHFGYDIAVSVRILALQLLEAIRSENGYPKPNGPTAEASASQFCNHVTNETNPLQWFVEATIITRCMPLETHTHALCLARSLIWERDTEYGKQRALNLATMMALGALLSADCEEAFDWPFTTPDLLSWYSTVDQALSIPTPPAWDMAMYPLTEMFGEWKYPQKRSKQPLPHPLPDLPFYTPAENITISFELPSPEEEDKIATEKSLRRVRNNDYCGQVYEDSCFDSGRLIASKKDLVFFTWPHQTPNQFFARYCLQTHHEFFPAVPKENLIHSDKMHYKNGIAIALGNNIGMMMNLYHAVSVWLLAVDQLLKVVKQMGYGENWRDHVQIILFPLKHRGGTSDKSANHSFYQNPELLVEGFGEEFANEFASNNIKSWFGILSSHPPQYLSELPKVDCWRRILIGTPQAEIGPVPWRLRPASHASLVWARAKSETEYKDLHVRLIQRAPFHNRVISNPYDVLKTLKYSLPLPLAVRVRKEEIIDDWAETPLYEQLLRASSTGVLIGAHGATLMHAAWLPPGALVVELMPTIPHYIHPLCGPLNVREVFFGYAAAVSQAWYVCIPQKVVVDIRGDVIWREMPTIHVHPPRLANIIRKLGPRIRRGRAPVIPREHITNVIEY